MYQYYLWRGLDAIEDLECDSESEARAALDSKVTGDWTLWRRNGFEVKLLGVKRCESGETFRFDILEGIHQWSK